MTDPTMFKEAREAIKNGENDRALDLLSRLLRVDKDNPEYWLWMSSIVGSTKEQEYCLQNVLRLDPENVPAKRGLTLLGRLSSDSVQPVPPIKRSWESDIGKDMEELRGFKKIMANPILRVFVFIIGGVIFTGLILAGIFGTRGIFKPRLTITPIAWTSTPTTTPTYTPRVRTSTPTPIFSPTPEPLWMLLEATYTPAPIYVNTPHPRLEAYRLAMRAYERGEYDTMITFMEQTLREEPDSPDVVYYIGEAYRLLGDFDNAQRYYRDAQDLNPNFAPPYLAIAIVRQTLNPRYNVLPDINNAIEKDPVFAEAFLARAIYYSGKMDYDAALEDIQEAIRVRPYDPRFYLEMANLYLAVGEDELALQEAEEAYERDITRLQAYLVLGKAYLANDMPDKALEKIKIYGLYEPDDPIYLALLGGALFEIGKDLDGAMSALDRAKDIDSELPIAHFYHGLTALGLGDTKQAVNDLYVAQSLEENNFKYNIWFGIALYQDGRFEDAYGQINASESLIRSDDQRAYFYYYKGKIGTLLARLSSVREAYQALLELPEGVVPNEWVTEAEEFLSPPTETPTPTSTLTITHTPTLTPSLTFTLTTSPSFTATRTPSSTSTLSQTPTRTATITPTR